MFFPRRSRTTGPDPHLEIKIALFSVGAILALVGMYLENRWVVSAAIAVLAAGFLMRFRRPDRDDGEEPR